jgi:hypothetical protein
MHTPSSVAADTDRGDPSVGGTIRSDDRLSPIEIVTVAYATWTVSFLIGLWLGVGWALALPLTVVLGVGVAVWARRSPVESDRVGGAERSRMRAGSTPGWILAGVLLFGWVVEPIGSGGPFVVAAIAVALLVLVDRRSGASAGASEAVSPRGVLVALVLAAAAAVAHSVSWTAFTAVMSALAIAAAVRELRHRDATAGSTTGAPTSWRAEWNVLAVGVGFGLWTAFTRQFNPDDSYYANKASHYANDAGNFEVVNHLFGTPEEPHVPKADVLSAWEPLAGMLSGVTGVHHATVLYVLLAPLAAALIPAANRYAARAFGARRPDVVALVAAAAMLHLESFGDSILLVDKIFQGKGVLVLVAMPMAIGAGVRYWEAPTARRLLVAVAAMVAALGLTPTAGAPAVGAGLAILAAGVVVSRGRPDIGGRARAVGAVPVIVALSFTLFAFWFQSSASQTDPTNTRFPGPENAWARRLVSARTDAVIEWGVGGLLVIFALVVVVLIGRTPMQRAFFTLVAMGLFLLLFNPLLFTPLFDDVLRLNFLAWRFGWILPASLVIGLAVDALDRPLPAVGRIGGMALVALVLVAALPLAARTDQEFPAPWDLQNRWIRGAELVIEATPTGGRYLATERVEIATTMLASDIYPTYARQRLLGSYGRSGTSDEFNVDLRNELARQIDGLEPAVDPIEALDALRIDTVCIDPRIDPDGYALLAAVPEKFEQGPRVRLCQIWTRVVAPEG